MDGTTPPTRALEQSTDDRRAAVEKMKKIGMRTSAIIEDIFFHTTDKLPSPVTCLKFMMDDLSEFEGDFQLKEEKDKVVADVGKTLKNLFHSNDESDHVIIKRALLSNGLEEFRDFITEAPRAIDDDNYIDIINKLIRMKNYVTTSDEYHGSRPFHVFKRKMKIVEAAKEIGIDLGLDPYTLYGENLEEISHFFIQRKAMANVNLIEAFCVLLGKDFPDNYYNAVIIRQLEG